MNSLLNIECSMFRDAKATDPQTVNLLQWLKSDKYLQQQQRVRSLTNEGERKAAKVLMPCIAPSGVFSKRGAAYLQKHTGLIAIDIDLKDNRHISNFADLKNELCKIPNVAYCGLSVSGNGYWLLILIAHPEKHELHFRFIETYFASKGLKIDPACKDVGRLRFYSYDADAYFNHAAKPLQAYYTPPPPTPVKYRQPSFYATDKPIWEQYNETTDFESILQKHGWEICGKKGRKTYYTRPGKSEGISAEFDPVASWTDKRTGVHYDNVPMFHVYSSSANPFEAGRGYSPFMVYAVLEHGGNLSEAAKKLMPAKSKAKAFTTINSKKQAQWNRNTIAPTPAAPVVLPPTTPVTDSQPIELNVGGYPAAWDSVQHNGSHAPLNNQNKINPPQRQGVSWEPEILELEQFFNSVELPSGPFKINSWASYKSLPDTIKNHLATVRANDGNRTFLPFLERLREFKSYLTA